MDTSTRLDFLLGNLRVTEEEVTPEEHFTVLSKVLRICTPVMKYLWGFVEIRTHIEHRPIGQYHFRCVPEGIVVFGGDSLDFKTRCLLVANVFQKTFGEGPQGGCLEIHDGKLLLTQDGRWVFWTTEYVRTVRHGTGFTGRRVALYETAKHSNFEALSDEHFMGLLEKHPRVCLKVIDVLASNMGRTIGDRRSWIRQMEGRETALNLIRSRFAP